LADIHILHIISPHCCTCTHRSTLRRLLIIKGFKRFVRPYGKPEEQVQVRGYARLAAVYILQMKCARLLSEKWLQFRVSLATESLHFSGRASAFLLAWLMSGIPTGISFVITLPCLGYIRSRSYVLYLYVFVAVPNKHNILLVLSLLQKSQQLPPSIGCKSGLAECHRSGFLEMIWHLLNLPKIPTRVRCWVMVFER